MSQITWKWELDRVIRYVLSDPISSVRCHLYELEQAHLALSPKGQSRAVETQAHLALSPEGQSRAVETWQAYLALLWTLHHQLLALPDLTTVTWLSAEAGQSAPSFMLFTTSIKDSKTKLIRVIRWLKSLSYLYLPERLSLLQVDNPVRLPGGDTGTLVAQQSPVTQIPSWPELERFLEFQAYLHQLEAIYQTLVKTIGPDQTRYPQLPPSILMQQSILGEIEDSCKKQLPLQGAQKKGY